MPLKKNLCLVVSAAIILLSLTACKSEPAQAPNSEQQMSLDKLHKKCSAASLDENGHLKHLAAQRKRLGLTFTCDELKQTCEENYIGAACESMRLVTAVQNAYERACRSNSPASSACKALVSCNIEGFASQPCQTAIAPYNR